MIRALRTGNYSVVIGWMIEELTEEEHASLVEAAKVGNAVGFIIAPCTCARFTQETAFRAKNSL
ncbi:cell division inhibitor [Salmonella enterica subsp. enterica]|uniref:Cell division inhibitor n=1 Tax=Salmonella enterica I TaxID=59201 RepID=A0A379WW04_SALET|nr:cell division inhibitor [Salmonella enterica subsp. enterica]